RRRSYYEANPNLPWLGPPSPSTPREALLYPGRWGVDLFTMLNKRREARFELDNARAFDRILVNSRYSYEAVLRVYGLQAAVCELGIDTEFFRPAPVERRRQVVGVGFLSRHKDALTALQAIALLPPPRPRLIWVAHGF